MNRFVFGAPGAGDNLNVCPLCARQEKRSNSLTDSCSQQKNSIPMRLPYLCLLLRGHILILKRIIPANSATTTGQNRCRSSVGMVLIGISIIRTHISASVNANIYNYLIKYCNVFILNI